MCTKGNPICSMEKLTLNGMTIERGPEGLVVVHHKTGMRVVLSEKAFLAWLTRQVRAAI